MEENDGRTRASGRNSPREQAEDGRRSRWFETGSCRLSMFEPWRFLPQKRWARVPDTWRVSDHVVTEW